MKLEQLVEHYPRLYHMAESGTWDGIQKNGLRSTSALLDLFEITGQERTRIEDEHRPECVTITHKKHGKAVIRDQKPMSESALLKCLTKPVTPREWYRTLNGNVFFWLHPNRLNDLLDARAYRDKHHCVLTLDCRELVGQYVKDISLSPMNSGSTIYRPLPRGRGTFLPIADFPFDERRATRPIQNSVVELLVKYAVPNVEEFVLKVEERKGASTIQTIFQRR